MVGHFDAVKQRQFGIRRSTGLSREQKKLILISSALIVAWCYIGYRGWNMLFTSTPEQQVVVKSVEPKLITKEILVPVAEIKPGVELKASMFTKEARPIEQIGSNSIYDFEQVRGSYSRSMIAASVPLTKEYVTAVRPNNLMSAKIPEGFRAVTIQVDALSAVEGWARPGAKVDVVWTSSVDNKQVITTIVENSLVLSSETGQQNPSMEHDMESRAIPNFVTLLVSSKDAQKIALAKSTGNVSLNLRGDNDQKALEHRSVTLAQLMRSDVGAEREQAEGMIKIGGENFIFREGKLVPVDSSLQ